MTDIRLSDIIGRPMLRAQDQTEQREADFRERLKSRGDAQSRREVVRAALAEIAGPLMTVNEVADYLKVSYGTIRTICLSEPGVLRLRVNGGKNATIRIPFSVVERIVRRSAVPVRSSPAG